jgi:hypothetical protein
MLAICLVFSRFGQRLVPEPSKQGAQFFRRGRTFRVGFDISGHLPDGHLAHAFGRWQTPGNTYRWLRRFSCLDKVLAAVRKKTII